MYRDRNKFAAVGENKDETDNNIEDDDFMTDSTRVVILGDIVYHYLKENYI